MIAALVGIQAASGLLMHGAWDLWAQSAVLLVLIAGLALWVLSGLARGRLPLPSVLPAAWAATLAALSFVSAFLSPVSVYALPVWACTVVGLWLIPAMTLISARGRTVVEQVIRAAAWALALLACYQRFHGQSYPSSALLNQNVLAGAILLLLPFAVRCGDGLLVVALIICLWWTRSVGAWLGLAAALVLHRRAIGSVAYWGGITVGLCGLVAVCTKLQSPEVLHRWHWWAAAWSMAADAPLRGLGPGAFAYALPAYVGARPELNSLFAHQHFLETAAERGWPYLALWLAGIGILLRRASADKRFGPIAALAHGFFDYALSVPGVFWLFCLSIAWALPESGKAVAARGGRRVLSLAFVMCLAIAAAWWVAGNWAADRLRARAFADFARPSSLPEDLRLLSASEEIRPHPEAARGRAQIELVLSLGADSSQHLEAAADDLQRAVSLDPYRASNWAMLEQVYRRLGRLDDAMQTHMRAL